MAETADRPSLFESPKDFHQLTVSSIRSDENGRRRPPWRSSASRRTPEDENETPQSSNGEKSNSSNPEEIIAMFRRIQSAISKDESVKTKRNSNLSEDKTSPESVLEVLRKSRKQMKGDAGRCHICYCCEIVSLTRYTDIAGKLEAEIFFNFFISLACKKKGQT